MISRRLGLRSAEGRTKAAVAVAKPTSECTCCCSARNCTPKSVLATLAVLAAGCAALTGCNKLADSMAAGGREHFSRAQCVPLPQVSKTAPALHGLLYDSNYETPSFNTITNDLLGGRLTWVEYPIQQLPPNTPGLAKVAAEPGDKYVRYFLLERGRAECAAFEDEVSRYPAQKLPRLRSLGLPAGMCIAMDPVPEPQSEYELRERQSETRDDRLNIWWTYDLSLLDRRTGAPVWTLQNRGARPLRRRGGVEHWSCHDVEAAHAYRKKALVIEPNALIQPVKVEKDNVAPDTTWTPALVAVLEEASQDAQPSPVPERDDVQLVIDSHGSVRRTDFAVHWIEGQEELKTDVWRRLGDRSLTSSLRAEDGVLLLAGWPARSAEKPPVLALMSDAGRRIRATLVDFPRLDLNGDYAKVFLSQPSDDVVVATVFDLRDDSRRRPVPVNVYRVRVSGFGR